MRYSMYILSICCLLLASTTLQAQKDIAPFYPPTEQGEYLNVVQEKTFRYFWDFAHPVSGLIPERTATPNIVTSGGTGFGIMALVVGTYRQWITRQQAVERMLKITRFLEKADRFHGAWSHWLDGRTGKVVPFSRYDDGGDLVETAYLINGLLVAREYFDGKSAQEVELRQRIDRLWRSVEWNWYVHDGKLLWHWSPNYGWQMNHAIGGYNECFITYVLALASPTHPITPEVYVNTWKKAEPWHYINGKEFVGYRLPIGFDYGGPLFFAHYSYLSLDPRWMQDEDVNYWDLNVKHTLINRAYCIYEAPKEYGYSEENWGLTASDNHQFYGAHNPKEDNGTITPTAALSSFPYTPAFSMQVLMHLYRREGNRLFGDYGFFDAYNKHKGWYSNQYLAIDQGPIVIMIENYRSGLLWKLGEKIKEMQQALPKMGIRNPDYPTGYYMYIVDKQTQRVPLLKHPDLGKYVLDYYIATPQTVSIELQDKAGKTTKLLTNQAQTKGPQQLTFLTDPGEYTIRLLTTEGTKELPFRLY
ncbi:glucoamylase family protein [Telluribacter humicola]|uniref:glucoamylase family protein n=1 Tax=Telluribacter humicola TaxID=1720261 RepID=UPI001A97746F|nr:glucoamylase family protein [Telluribacter humicola]